MITLDDFQYWLNLIVNGVEPLVDDIDRDYVNQALLLMPSAPLNEQSWENWTNDIKLTSSRKGKQLFLPLRKALTGKKRVLICPIFYLYYRKYKTNLIIYFLMTYAF